MGKHCQPPHLSGCGLGFFPAWVAACLGLGGCIIVASNALMVVFFQYAVTRWTERRNPVMMLAVGSALYGLGTGSVALGKPGMA